MVDVVVIVVGGTKFCVKGLVVLLLTVLHCSALIGKSLNKVSLCTPARPLEEKWVTETGRSMVREESSSRLVGDVTSLSTWDTVCNMWKDKAWTSEASRLISGQKVVLA